MIRAVYFDYGGVLSPGGLTSVSRELPAQYFGIDASQIDVDSLDNRLHTGDIDITQYFEELSAQYGLGRPPLTENVYVQRGNIFAKNDAVYAQADMLRTKGITTGILSNVTAINSQLLRKNGYYDGFDPVVLSCDVGVRKPDRSIYQAALSEVGLPAGDILLVDDQDKCIRAAREIGMNALLAVSPEQVAQELQALITGILE